MYLHLLPLATQARRALWMAINPHTGIRRIEEAFPPAIVSNRRENEMTLELINGSVWCCAGSDNFQETLIGTSLGGIVFSEFALSSESAWAFLSPILNENREAWSLMISTPRGRNHAYRFYQNAIDDPDWFAAISPATETGVFSPKELEAARQELVNLYGPDHGEGLFNQEYLCDWNEPVSGAIYGKEMTRAEQEGRIGSVPHNPKFPVHVSYDIGYHDATSLWFWQCIGPNYHIIDYYEHSQSDISHYVREMQRRPYTWGSVVLPWDAGTPHIATGHSAAEVMRSLGVPNIRVLPRQNNSVNDGIDAVRRMLGLCWFDRQKCKRGIECLQNYKRQWDDKRNMFADQPYHDEFSHGADSFRYLAVSNVRNMVRRDLVYSNRGIV